MNLSIFGYIAVICTGSQMIPEIIKALKTHHLRDVAWPMLGLHLIGSTSWCIYGFYITDYPLIISASLNIILGTTLITLKSQYDKMEQPILSEQKVPLMTRIKQKFFQKRQG